MNPLLIASFIIAILVEICLPLILILYLIRRLKTSWKIIGVGALIFILTQILHIAFLFLINEPIKSLILSSNLSHNLQIAINAAILGILAGLFEETGRYLGFKHIMKKARTWNQGVAFGAGWGGVESIIIGFLVSLSLVNLILIPNIDINTLNETSDLTPEQLGGCRETATAC
ncbi:MAG: YhfC family intramembrane metalloprotease [Candidatus Altiarchaeales archaeon]|nr:YhfC family intramembrane metalloprotease [Candidatus Altiarchaeales archaeon]